MVGRFIRCSVINHIIVNAGLRWVYGIMIMIGLISELAKCAGADDILVNENNGFTHWVLSVWKRYRHLCTYFKLACC